MKDEYEVDLTDYLLIAWQKRWIILSVTLIAAVSVALYSYSQPDIYQANSLLQWREPPISWQYSPSFFESPKFNIETVVPALGIEEAVDIFNAGRVSGASSMTAELRSTELIWITVSGELEPSELESSLAAYVAERSQIVQRSVLSDFQALAESYERAIAFYQSERDELISEMRQWLELREQKLLAERERITLQIDEMISMLGSESADSAASAQVDRRLAILMNQLGSLEAELIENASDQESQFLRPGLGLDLQLSNLNRQITDAELVISEYEHLAGTSWSPVQVIEEAKASGAPIGPARLANVFMAAIAGLLLGLIFSFIVSYVQRLEVSEEE